MDDYVERKEILDFCNAEYVKALLSAQPEHFRDVTKKMDVISRQAAIDALLEEVRLVDGYYVENDEVINKDDAIEAIQLLPPAQPELIEKAAYIRGFEQGRIQGIVDERVSAQPKQQWILCSERLPEVGTYVLISKKALNFRSNLPNVCTAHRSCDPRSGKEEWNDMLFGKLDDDDVLAWMPLPEPYQKEGEK